MLRQGQIKWYSAIQVNSLMTKGKRLCAYFLPEAQITDLFVHFAHQGQEGKYNALSSTEQGKWNIQFSRLFIILLQRN